MVRGPQFTLLIPLALILGCGSEIHQYSGQIAIVPSPLIATGAWNFNGQTAAGDYTHPIGGFLGALNVTGNTVQAGLSIGSSDSPSSVTAAACLGRNGGSGSGITVGLTVAGTIANGILTLDGDFPANHAHITGQISPNGQKLTSGSYTVTGSCATTSPRMDAYWNAPLTGTYKGQLNSVSGINPQVTATLTQASYYWGYGYIPVDGTIVFTTAGCNTNVQLNDGFVLGELSELGGHTNGTIYNDVLLLGFDDPSAQTISNIDWGYPDAGCGAQVSATTSSGSLTRQ